MTVINARISNNNNIQAKTLIVGKNTNLADLGDVNSSQLAQGSVLIYDATQQTWLAKSIMDDGTYVECGQY
jgi:hypothetical protein